MTISENRYFGDCIRILYMLFNIKKYFGQFCRNIHLINPFGLIGVMRLIWWRYKKVVEPDKADSWESKKAKFLYDYLYKRFAGLVQRETDTIAITSNHIIWVYWWQGEESMPPIVKKCYESVLKHANGATVQLITKENYMQFVDVPQIMIDKQEKGIICHAHFSDIYRCCLLYKYGGLWLDATIYVTAPIDKGIFEKELFSMRKDPSDGQPFNKYYSSFCFGTKAGNLIFKNLSVMFIEYVKKEKYFIDYFVFDILIQIIRDESLYCNSLFEQLEYNHPDQLAIQLNFNNEFDDLQYTTWLNRTSFHKLTYKGNLMQVNHGNETFYGHILNQK